jgi:predicted nucleotidyltransferase
MHRSEILSLLKSRFQTMHANFGVKDLMLFGSAARDELRSESDVDVLVEFEQQPNFDRFMDLKFFLEDILKAKVDLVTREALKPRMRPMIEKEAIHVA